jgi:hypothetical protein
MTAAARALFQAGFFCSKQSIAAPHHPWQANIAATPLRKRLVWAIGVSPGNTFWAWALLGRQQFEAIHIHQPQIGDLEVGNDREGKKGQMQERLGKQTPHRLNRRT